MVDDITIVIPPAVAEFVLRNNGNGTFDLIAPLTSSQRDAARTWPNAGLVVGRRDVDLNGADDLLLEDLSEAVGEAFDQTVFASIQRGRAPIQVSAHDPAHQPYHRDLLRWLLDPGYFTNVPLRVVSAQPPTPVWYASTPDPTDYGIIHRLIAQCQQRHSNSVCGYTSVDPTPNSADTRGCVRQVNVLDPNTLQPIGAATRDVCEHDAHVYVYIPGSVTVQPDNSIFSAPAEQTGELLEGFLADCSSVPAIVDAQLRYILNTVFGGPIFTDHGVGRADIANSFDHPPFPNDFTSSDPTFHHYDVPTEFCTQGTSGCNATHLAELLRYYSYPSWQLKPDRTEVDFTERLMVRGGAGPAVTYIVPGGWVKQRFVQPPFGSGAIQNVTEPGHVFYPGQITRLIRPVGRQMEVMTHGIGFNRFSFTQSCGPSQSNAIRVFLGFSNDYFGPKIFRALDRQMKKFFVSNRTNYPSASSAPGFGKPDPQLMGPSGAYVSP